jgi:raffinose/stachyose/melibiose transport system permease protein
MVLPALLIFVVFVPIPVITSVVVSFTNWRGLGSMRFVGLQNYVTMFARDLSMQVALGNTILWVLGSLMIQLVPAFLIALLLNRKVVGGQFFRSVVFLPTTFSAVAVSLIWYFVYHPEIGLLNQFIRVLGPDDFTFAWLRNEDFALWGVLISVAWQWTGYYVVILLAALAGIPRDLMDAAEIDGASFPQVVRFIMVPYLIPAFRIVSVLAVTSAFKGFATVFVMTQGGPNNATLLLGLHMYFKGFRALEFGYGSAISTLIIVLCVTATFVLNRLFTRDAIDG